MKPENLLKYHGAKFTATIDNTKCIGEIIVKGPCVYLANNERGTIFHKNIKTNFKFIWLYNFSVVDLFILDKQIIKEREKYKEVYAYEKPGVEGLASLCKTIMLFECADGIVCVDPSCIERFKHGVTFTTKYFSNWKDVPKETHIPFTETDINWIDCKIKIFLTGEVRTIKYISKDSVIDNNNECITLQNLFENYTFANGTPFGEKIIKID